MPESRRLSRATPADRLNASRQTQPNHYRPLASLAHCASAVSFRWNRTPNGVELLPRAVPLAPEVDVVPVDPVSLDGDHVTHVLKVFGSLPVIGPAKLHHNHILGRGKPCLPIQKCNASAPLKPLLVVRVVAQKKQFNLEGTPANVQDMTLRDGRRFKRELRIELKCLP